MPKNSGQLQPDTSGPDNVQIRRRNKLRRHTTVVSNVIIRGYHHVSDHAKMTFLSLDSYDWPDENGFSKGHVYPSMSTIAADRGKSRLSILRDIQELAEAGLLTVESGKERGKSNIYWIEEPSEEEVEKYLGRYVKKGPNLVEFPESSSPPASPAGSTAAKDGAKFASRKETAAAGRKQETGGVSTLQQEGVSTLQQEGLSSLKHEGIDSESIPRKRNDSNQGLNAKASGKERAGQSGYINRIMQDFSKGLHDLDHADSNATQANNLFRESGLDEKRFVEIMYEARKRTSWQMIHKTAGDGSDGSRNRCPYFFKVLRSLLEENRP